MTQLPAQDPDREVSPEPGWQVHRQGEAQVLAGILLVAERRAPSVLVSNIRDAVAVVDVLSAQARELGVGLELLERRDGRGHDVRVHLQASEAASR